jgi:negative regulator of sigma E activity
MIADDDQGPDVSTPLRPLPLSRRRPPVFRSRRPWRRRLAVAAYVAAFAVVGVALITAISEIRNEAPSPPTHPHGPVAEEPSGVD